MAFFVFGRIPSRVVKLAIGKARESFWVPFDFSGPGGAGTISNLEIFDFDLGIGTFNGAGGTDAFNGTQILNNHFRIPADLNATVAPVDVNQNIGIH